MKIKLMLFGEKDTCNRLRLSLGDEELDVRSIISDEKWILDAINRHSPDIILVTDTSPIALRMLHQVYVLRPRSIPVVIADVEDTALVQRIMQSGVSRIISPNVEPMQLISEIKSIYSDEQNRITLLEGMGSVSSKSKVIMLWGAKSGMGKTTLAVNLALKLAERKNRVVVLDYDLQFGDVGNYLGINSKGTIVDLLQEQSNPNVDTIRQFLSMHMLGVSFLQAPTSPEDAKAVSPSQAERIISALRVYYDYVIIDTAGGFDDINVACMDIASSILLFTQADIPALRATKKSLSIISAVTDEAKIKLVLGRHGKPGILEKARIDEKKVSKALGIKVWKVIPEENAAAISAANLANPMIKVFPKSKMAKVVGNMADEIDGAEKVEKKTAKKGYSVFGKKA